MTNLRDTFPELVPSGSLYTDSTEEQVRFRLDEMFKELRSEYVRHDHEKLPVLDELVARFTSSENETLSHALIFVKSLRVSILSPDSPLQECSVGTLHELVLRVRKEIVALGEGSVYGPSRTQLSPTLESLLSALQESL